MLALCERRQVPGFAMAFYDVLASAGDGVPPPTPLALVADDAILLAPIEHQDGWRGLLLAEDTASGQVRAFRLADDPQTVVTLVVPASPDAETPAWAAADSWLPIVRSPDSRLKPCEQQSPSSRNIRGTNDDQPTTPELDRGEILLVGSS